MKRILIALLLLVFAVSAEAKQKLLVVVGGNQTGRITASGFINSQFYVNMKALGMQSDVVLATDTTAIDSLVFGSTPGDYSKAVFLNMPEFDSTCDTDTDANTCGVPRLGMYLDRNSAKAWPIDMVLLCPEDIDPTSSELFDSTYTGIRGFTDIGAGAGTDAPLVNADGDSIYSYCHFANTTEARVATNDSLSWVHPVIWRDVAVTGSANQVYAYTWYTDGAYSNKIWYVRQAQHTYNTGFVMSVIANGQDFASFEMPVLLREFGYYHSSYSADTTSWGANMIEIMDYVVAQGMKLDLCTSTYQWDDQQDLRSEYQEVEIMATTYPSSLRFTHWTLHSWTDGNDWLGVGATRTQAQMEARISGSVTDAAVNMGTTILGNNRLLGYYHSCYNGDWDTAHYGSAVFRAMAAQGITSVFALGGAYEFIGRDVVVPNKAIICPVRTHIRQSAGGAATELSVYAVSREMRNYSGSTAANSQTTMTNAETAKYTANVFKECVGGYACIEFGGTRYSSSTAGKASRHVVVGGFYQPGHMWNAATITGGAGTPTVSNLMTALSIIKNSVDMCNAITPGFCTYTWAEDTNNGRYTNRKWPDSHVIRN